MSLKQEIQALKDKHSEDTKDTKKVLKNGVNNPFSNAKRNEDITDYYNSLSPLQQQAFKKQLELKKIRNNYIKYLKYVYKDTFLVTRFHALLAKLCQSVIENMENGKRVRLCISVPPQSGKTTTITKTLPSWFVGKHPNSNVIITAYNSDKAVEFGDNNRNLIKDYGKEIFDIEPSESMDRKDEFGIKGKKGGIISRGLRGGLTGNPANLLIVDDPFKNGEEASNLNIREKIWDTFRDSAMTRVHGNLEVKGDAVIVIHTRWNDDDLIGRLEKLGNWSIINIPAIWEEGTDKLLKRKIGEPLLPELGFDNDFLEEKRVLLGDRLFRTLYQGKPYLDNGTMLKRENIRTYNKESMPSDFEEITLSCDLTFGGISKNSDPYCMSIWGRNGANHYLLDVVSKKAGFTETIEMIKQLCSKYPTMRRKIIERKANGQATIEMLNSHIGGMIPFDPKGASKVDRFNAILPYFEAGNVFFPDDKIIKDIEKYIEQLLRFPNASHDDFVDTVSQYLLNYQYNYSGKVNTDSCFAMISKVLRGFKI